MADNKSPFFCPQRIRFSQNLATPIGFMATWGLKLGQLMNGELLHGRDRTILSGLEGWEPYGIPVSILHPSLPSHSSLCSMGWITRWTVTWASLRRRAGVSQTLRAMAGAPPPDISTGSSVGYPDFPTSPASWLSMKWIILLFKHFSPPYLSSGLREYLQGLKDTCLLRIESAPM